MIPFSPSKLLRRLFSSTVTENLLIYDVDGVNASYVNGDTDGVCVCVYVSVRV